MDDKVRTVLAVFEAADLIRVEVLGGRECSSNGGAREDNNRDYLIPELVIS